MEENGATEKDDTRYLYSNFEELPDKLEELHDRV
jgi:hypothetical protein